MRDLTMADDGRDKAGAKPHVVIVGGGIAGLTAAFWLRNEPVRITVLEASSRLGGKLSVSPPPERPPTRSAPG
jgi:oxygen-dependent protoporphyrinogen oxidase